MALANNSITLFSPYEPGECAKRIAALIDHDESIAAVSKEFDGTHDLIGKADAGVVCLRRRLPSSFYARWMRHFAQADIAFMSQFLRETLNAGNPPNAV